MPFLLVLSLPSCLGGLVGRAPAYRAALVDQWVERQPTELPWWISG